MLTLIFWVVVAAALILLLPAALPRFVNFSNNSTRWMTDIGLRLVGVIILLFAIASTSYVHVPDGHLGQLFRVYGGGSLPEGRIVAVNGENGPQSRIFTPGFHFEPLVNVLYEVDVSQTEEDIPAGKVGVLIAKDGDPLRPGQAFADPFPTQDKDGKAMGYRMLDAEVFLKNGGQRGPQLSVLPPGKWRVNHNLWRVEQKDAKEIAAGFVGVVKSNIWADIDFGTLQAKKPDNCTVIKRVESADSNVQRLAAPIVPVGCTGVWDKSLQPGKYYFNPDAFTITEIDTRAQVWTYAGGYDRCTISLEVDAAGQITQKRTCTKVDVDQDNADKAIFVKMEGWDIPLELRAVAQVSPDEASCVVAGVGTLKQVEDRVLTPSIRAITRDVAGGTYEVNEPKADENGKPILDKDGQATMIKVNRPTKALDLISQRPLIEGEIERRIRPEAEKSCVTIREVRLGEPAIPPELLVAVRREQLATQLAKAFTQEKGAQEKRVDSEKAKSTADQQGSLVRSEIGVQTSKLDAERDRNKGQGERDMLAMIAEGQKQQKEVLGTDATVRLRMFEQAIAFFKDKPDILTAALTNAQKFVPNIQVGGNEGGGGLLTALLGNALQSNTTTPTTGTTGR